MARVRGYGGPVRPNRLSRHEWQAREVAHQQRADALTAGHAERRRSGRKHPIEDFLFEYYNFPVTKLRRWHPGPGQILEDAAGQPRAGWPYYRRFGDGSVALDLGAFTAQRLPAMEFIRDLLARTLSRPPYLACFGLHEWAMVYRAAPQHIRHTATPLRLSRADTDAVVESHAIRCSHFDAYRFFTADAVPRNALAPTRETQRELEQPGCLHAGMDVYKWAHKLVPLTPGDLLLDAFELARDVRELDMRASPYDLSGLGYSPIRIETPEGKSEYAGAQRAFALRANDLRRRLLTVIAA